MEFRKVSEVPSPGMFGQLSKYTIESMERMSTMEVGDIFLLPLSEIQSESERKLMLKKYCAGIHSAKRRLSPRKFVVNRRGDDLYVRRKE
tara:strand:+ start:15640 stop:15909 length:270 start_codon:yes stop_codon:yes gene_type:complete